MPSDWGRACGTGRPNYRGASGSVWPASLAHAAHNLFWDLFMGWTVGASPLVTEYLAGESGVLPIVGYTLLAVWLIRRLHHARRAISGLPVVPGALAPAGQPATAAHDEGYMTSVAYSPELGHWVGLGLLQRGPDRVGERIRAVDPLRGADIEVEVCSPVFVDPKEERLRV